MQALEEEDAFPHSPLSNKQDDDFLDGFHSQLLIHGNGGVIVGGDDFNKIHQNFAGDTFSQISSTYEQAQNQPQSSVHIINNNKHQQSSQNEVVRSNSANANNTKHSKLYSYEEKKIGKKEQQNNDELLDLAILNNMNEDLNSPKDNINMNNNRNNILGNANFNNNGAFPSPHSNLNIIMNSENLQQSDIHSTLTIYNSGIFDDASIMRILDKSISDDSLFLLQFPEDGSNNNHPSNHKQQYQQQLQQSQMRIGPEMEQTLRFECEDVKQILGNMSGKLKEKLQKQRQNSSSSQLVAIQFEELKQYEILTTSAIEKIRHIQSIGKQIFDSQKVRVLTFKNYKQNLKIQLHNQIQKFKEVCKKQYNQAEHQKFKYQINEFEFNEKIKQLEERLDQQAEEINKLANKNEQLKYEKQMAAQKNNQKLNDMEKIIKYVMKNLQQNDKIAQAKNNNSFCIGTNHSLLLKPRQRINAMNIYHQHQQIDIQQSVDEKENESILSNKGSVQVINNKEIIGYLNQMKRLLKENKKINLQLNNENKQQQQEGGSYYESSSMNIFGVENDQKRDSLIQQSQFIPAESSQADINQAFIMSESRHFSSSSSNQSDQSNFLNNKRVFNIEEDKEENNQSLDYNFQEDQIITIMDGNNMNNQNSDDVDNTLQFLDDKILPNDLVGQHQKPEINESSRIIKEQNFPADLSLISQQFQNSVQGGLNFHSGRNIFIADEFINASLDFNSRNNDANLYSGGSSQFQLIQAFSSLKGMKKAQGKNDSIVIQVRDRQITMPKLNLEGINGKAEKYKFNIPVNNASLSSTNSIGSSEIQSSQSQVNNLIQQKTLQQQITSQQNITSFQNESISKQYYNNIIENSFPDEHLDKAIYIDNNMSNSKINKSAESHNDGAPFIRENMLDSFKKELSIIDKGNHNNTKSSEKKQSQQIIKPVLDQYLFEDQSTIQFNDEFQKNFANIYQQKQKSNQKDQVIVELIQQQQQEEKSLDLSVNVSRFKKSQSDPNIMFNDVDSDEEFQRNKDTQESKGNGQLIDGKNFQINSKANNNQQMNQKFDFSKLKTPQAALSKASIKIDQNEEQKEKQGKDQKILYKSNLNQFQNKFRASSNFSKESKTTESQDNQIKVIKNVKKIVPVEAIGKVTKNKILKFNAISKKDLSVVDQRDQDQSILIQQFVNLNKNESLKKIEINNETNLEKIIEQKETQKEITKKKTLAQSSLRRESINQDSEVSSNNQIQKTQNNSQQKLVSQLMQNYTAQAAKMQGIKQKNPTSIKFIQQKSGLIVTRNSSGINSNLSQPEMNIVDQDHQEISQQQQNQQQQKQFQQNLLKMNEKVHQSKPLRSNDNNMLQQLKDYQESQDLNVSQGVQRQGKSLTKLIYKNKEQQDSNYESIKIGEIIKPVSNFKL